MATAITDLIVSFPKIPNFDQLQISKAQEIIYNELVPACRSQRVILTVEGNNRKCPNVCYQYEKKNYTLLNVERIQKAFACLSQVVQRKDNKCTGSYGLKHVVERFQGEYITNGDLIAVMLLSGFAANFGKADKPNINASFEVKVVVKEDPEAYRREIHFPDSYFPFHFDVSYMVPSLNARRKAWEAAQKEKQRVQEVRPKMREERQKVQEERPRMREEKQRAQEEIPRVREERQKAQEARPRIIVQITIVSVIAVIALSCILFYNSQLQNN